MQLTGPSFGAASSEPLSFSQIFRGYMTIKIKKERRGAHEHLDVFVGPDKDHLALSGCLVLRSNEAKEVEYALNAPHKACSCGKVYTEASWRELSFVGLQPTTDDNNRPFNLELRNCRACGTTLACEELP